MESRSFQGRIDRDVLISIRSTRVASPRIRLAQRRYSNQQTFSGKDRGLRGRKTAQFVSSRMRLSTLKEPGTEWYNFSKLRPFRSKGPSCGILEREFRWH